VESRDLVEPRLIFYVTGYTITEAPSTVRVRLLRERRSRGVAMVAPVEVGEGGIDLLIRNELLKQHQTRDRKAVGASGVVETSFRSSSKAVDEEGAGTAATSSAATCLAMSRASAKRGAEASPV